MSILSTAKNFVVKQLNAVSSIGGWWPFVREPYSGAWQKNEEWKVNTVAAYHAVYACITLIAGDIAKLPFRVMKLSDKGIWLPVKNSPYANLLRKPNKYQNHIQFKEWWITSKLFRGNTYVLKVRNNRGLVIALYVLNPAKVTVLVATNGDVYYELAIDELNQVEETITVPASEIIHDRMCCLFHPLVGISPLFACGLAAHQGLQIQEDSSRFFSNGANPGGILTAPGAISQETADRLKSHWNQNYTGENAGKVAVVGDGLKFEALKMTAVDAQLIDQLKWSATTVCSAFKVPPYKIGIAAIPGNNNIEALNLDYYCQALQLPIELMEICLDEGLEFTPDQGVELNLDVLLRMDSATLMKILGEGVKGSIMAPNEGRLRLNLAPLDGGDTVYMQQQNYSLAALNERDKTNPLVAPPTPTPPAANPEPAVVEQEEPDENQMLMFTLILEKELSAYEYR
jgi:HK97 family phage portal protein